MIQEQPSLLVQARSSAAMRVAVGLWIALACAVTVKTLVSPDRHTVFPKVAVRAIAWWSGEPLYVKLEGLGRFPYSPTCAVLMTPFAVLGHRLGGVAWALLNIGVYVWGLRQLVRRVLPGRWPTDREAVFLMLAMIGAIRGVWNAQSNALIIGLMMGGVAAVAGKRWWPAAFLLALPVYLKVWPIVIPMLLVVFWPRELGGRLLVALIVGAAVPFFTQRPAVVLGQYAAWVDYLGTMSDDVVGSYRDAWTVVRLLGLSIPQNNYRLVQVLTGGLTLLWCAWQWRDKPSVRHFLTWTLAAGCTWLMIFGPAVEYNTYVVLAPMVTWAVLASFEARRGRLLSGVAFVMTMILGAGGIERSWVGLCPGALAVLPAGALLFGVFLFWGARAFRKETHPIQNHFIP